MANSRFLDLIIYLDAMPPAQGIIAAQFLNRQAHSQTVFIAGENYPYSATLGSSPEPGIENLHALLGKLNIVIRSLTFFTTIIRSGDGEYDVCSKDILGAGAFGVVNDVCGRLLSLPEGGLVYRPAMLVGKHMQASSTVINREVENANLANPRSVKRVINLSDIEGGRLEQQYSAQTLEQIQARKKVDLQNGAHVHALLVEKRVPGYDLEKILARDRANHFTHLSVDMRLQACRNVVRAVQFLHQLKWVHRDLKPANLMLNVDNPLLPAAIIDNGYLTAPGPCVTYSGSPLYASPENHTRYRLAMQSKAGMSGGGNIPVRFPPLTYAEDLYSVGLIWAELMCVDIAAQKQMPGATPDYKLQGLFAGINIISEIAPLLKREDMHNDHSKRLEELIYKIIDPLTNARGGCADALKKIEMIMLERQLSRSSNKLSRALNGAAIKGGELRVKLDAHACTYNNLRLDHVPAIMSMFSDALNKVEDVPEALTIFLDRVGAYVLLAPGPVTHHLVASCETMDEVALFATTPRTVHELGLTSKAQVVYIVNKLLNDYMAACNRLLEMLRKVAEIKMPERHPDYQVVTEKRTKLVADIQQFLLDQRPLSLDQLAELSPRFNKWVGRLEPDFKFIWDEWEAILIRRRGGLYAGSAAAIAAAASPTQTNGVSSSCHPWLRSS